MKRIPDGALLDEINRLANDDSPPTAREFADKAEYGVTAIRRRWGSWNAGVREAGYTPSKTHDIPGEKLLNEINRLADGSSPPTKSEFNEEAKYSDRTVENRWGSWNEALQEAGFTPNQKINISDETLLNSLRKDARGQIAPPHREETTDYSFPTYSRRFGTWWKASVRAGLRPCNRRPLTYTESQKFFEATIKQQRPRRRLIGLLSQFTGLPPKLYSEISPNRIKTPAESVVVTIPADETQSGQKWTFKLPGTWTNEAGEQQDTGLPGLLRWVLEQDGSMNFTRSTVKRNLYRISRDTGLEDRQQTHRAEVGNVPLVRHSDLRVTGGIQMARNGAPARRIRRHLGIEHTNWKADVEDFFLWLYVHEGYEHPDYDPPDVVLDSVL